MLALRLVLLRSLADDSHGEDQGLFDPDLGRRGFGLDAVLTHDLTEILRRGAGWVVHGLGTYWECNEKKQQHRKRYAVICCTGRARLDCHGSASRAAMPRDVGNSARLAEPWHTAARLAEPWHTGHKFGVSMICHAH